jgi:hypothetical protein
MSLNLNIAPVDEVWVGAYGAAKGACAATGSVESVELTAKNKANFGTAAKYKGAKVAGYATDPEVGLSIVGDHMSLANIVLEFGATVSGTDILLGSGLVGPMVERTIYVDGLFAGGVKKTGHAYKAVLPINAKLKPVAGAQDKWQLDFELLWDDTQASGSEYFSTADLATDTTPPTITATSPADAATGVAKAAGGVIDVTFSEAMNTGDFSAANVVMFRQSTGAPVTLTSIAAQDTGGTIMRLAYPLLTASVVYTVVVADCRDLAGNKLAAPKVFSFTTGA